MICVADALLASLGVLLFTLKCLLNRRSSNINESLILQVDDAGIREVKYEETDHYTVSKSFLDNPLRMVTELFSD